MKDVIQARLRRLRFQAKQRQLAYRQRHHAAGTWFRLRRVLADAESAYVIDGKDAAMLLSEGYRPEPVGAELEPAKTMIFVSADSLERIASRKQVPVRLGAELLDARFIALVRFA